LLSLSPEPEKPSAADYIKTGRQRAIKVNLTIDPI